MRHCKVDSTAKRSTKKGSSLRSLILRVAPEALVNIACGRASLLPTGDVLLCWPKDAEGPVSAERCPSFNLKIKLWCDVLFHARNTHLKHARSTEPSEAEERAEAPEYKAPEQTEELDDGEVTMGWCGLVRGRKAGAKIHKEGLESMETPNDLSSEVASTPQSDPSEDPYFEAALESTKTVAPDMLKLVRWMRQYMNEPFFLVHYPDTEDYRASCDALIKSLENIVKNDNSCLARDVLKNSSLSILRKIIESSGDFFCWKDRLLTERGSSDDDPEWFILEWLEHQYPRCCKKLPKFAQEGVPTKERS